MILHYTFMRESVFPRDVRRHNKVAGEDGWARSEQAEDGGIGPVKVSRNIRVSAGGFYGTTRSSFLMEVPMEPKVSIIVPVYNAEKSLARCVDSILNQEFRDFELILMNDGSRPVRGDLRRVCAGGCARGGRTKGELGGVGYAIPGDHAGAGYVSAVRGQ